MSGGVRGDAEGKSIKDIDRFQEYWWRSSNLGFRSTLTSTHPCFAILISGGETLILIGKMHGEALVQKKQRNALLLHDNLRAGREHVEDTILRTNSRIERATLTPDA